MPSATNTPDAKAYRPKSPTMHALFYRLYSEVMTWKRNDIGRGPSGASALGELSSCLETLSKLHRAGFLSKGTASKLWRDLADVKKSVDSKTTPESLTGLKGDLSWKTFKLIEDLGGELH